MAKNNIYTLFCEKNGKAMFLRKVEHIDETTAKCRWTSKPDAAMTFTNKLKATDMRRFVKKVLGLGCEVMTNA